jgi:hypothetical protein
MDGLLIVALVLVVFFFVLPRLPGASRFFT